MCSGSGWSSSTRLRIRFAISSSLIASSIAFSSARSGRFSLSAMHKNYEIAVTESTFVMVTLTRTKDPKIVPTDSPKSTGRSYRRDIQEHRRLHVRSMLTKANR